MILLEKTIDRLKAFEPSDGYYGAFSGGKDSQALYQLVRMSGVQCDWHFQRTSVDAPQILKFIRQHYPDVQWHHPKLTMFQLILKKGMLPTRIARFCCEELKEQGGAGRTVITGVRAEESTKRSTYQMVHFCKETHKKLIHPLLDWKLQDIWNLLETNHLPHCELYDPPYSLKRIGCIGCPMQGKRMWREFRLFPNFKTAYLNTIEKLMAIGKYAEFETPEQTLRWWILGKNKADFLERERQQYFCFDN